MLSRLLSSWPSIRRRIAEAERRAERAEDKAALCFDQAQLSARAADSALLALRDEQAAHGTARQRYHELVMLVGELRRDGLDPVTAPRYEPAPESAMPGADLPDVVRDAIEQRARPGTPLYRQLDGIARVELRAHKSDENAEKRVAAFILKGRDLDS